jgi:hypothetical protein
MKRKLKFPGLKKCLAMMRHRDPQTQEDGFHWLLPHAGDYVKELIEEFHKEQEHGLRCWLLELIGEARSADAFRFLAEQLRSDDEQFRRWAIRGLKNLGTKEARRLLWEARSFDFGSREATDRFRADLESVLRK